MHLDGPFLCRLAQFDSSQPWLDMGVELLLSHASVLQDEPSGLFSHGFDDATGRPNGAFWGRGQGWALLGLVDTLSVLPSGHASVAEIRHRLEALVERLRAYEVEAGRWHTVVDAPRTYLEASVSAFVALGIGDAVRLGVLSSRWQALADRALHATRSGLNAQGQLVGVSDATPVGCDVAHYAERPTGVFPWGQGPALLALLHSVKMEVA
jgi:rhamnogalacturonyl hydrolase YesR